MLPKLPNSSVGVCQIPKAWGEVKATTVYPSMTGQPRAALVLENSDGEIRFVDFGCNVLVTLGRQ